MKQVLLDTSFILTCVRQKIDFFEDLYFEGFHILIPKQVIREIEGISKTKKFNERENAKLALKLMKSNKFKKIDLKTKNVDNGIIKFVKANSDIIIGTLDVGIKKKTKNSKLVIRGKKRLEVV